MGLGLLLIPALGGYLFITRFNGTRDRAACASGYHVVFRSAAVGVVLFAVGHLLALLTDWFMPKVSDLWQAAFPIEYSGAAAASVLLGWGLPLVTNRFVDRLDARRQTALESGDHIGLVVDEAIENAKFIEVTLSSGKCYVGVPLARTYLARAGGDLVLIPIFSGHRDDATRELKLTVNYAPVLRSELRRNTSLEDFRVAVPIREVLSTRNFDLDTYAKFQRMKGGTIDDSDTSRESAEREASDLLLS